jgi:hypothetical protein
MPQCPTCGSTVSENAEVCPDCGMDLKDVETPSAEASPDASLPSPVEESASPGAIPIQVNAPSSHMAEISPAPAPPAETAPFPAPSSGGKAQIALKRSGILTGDAFPFAGRVVIGRFDPDSGPVDVDLGPLPEAAYISRRHSEIFVNDSGQWFVKDLGSRNGTFVRGKGQDQFQRIAGDQPLQDGDEIALGNARFEFHAG